MSTLFTCTLAKPNKPSLKPELCQKMCHPYRTSAKQAEEGKEALVWYQLSSQ